MKKTLYLTILISFPIWFCTCNRNTPIDPKSIDELQFSTILNLTLPGGIICAEGSELKFDATFINFYYDYSDLSVEWWSNQDGLLHTETPENDDNFTFTTSQLSYNIHTVSVLVRHDQNIISSDSLIVKVILPPAVTLSSIAKDYQSVSLNWNEYPKNDFLNYEVFRSTDSESFAQENIIAVIDNKSNTSFMDLEIELGRIYYYKVAVRNSNMLSSSSNIESVEPGIFIETANTIRHMLADPNRSYIYAIDYQNDELLFINTESNAIEKTLTIGDGPIDLDIDITGNTLYVISMLDDHISIIDLQSQTLVDTRILPEVATYYLDDLHYHIACGKENRLFYVDADLKPTLRLLDIDNWTVINKWEADGVGDLAVTEDGNTLFIWDQFLWEPYIPFQSEAYLKKIDCSNDDLSLVQTSYNNVGRDPLDYPVILYSNDQKVICKRFKFLTSDISSLDDFFGGKILLVAEEHNKAFSHNRIYTLSDGLAIEFLPISSTTIAVPFGKKLLYSYQEIPSRIYILPFE